MIMCKKGFNKVYILGELDNGEKLRHLFNTMKDLMVANYEATLLMFGGVALAVHYEELSQSFDGVPLILAWGEPVSGKSTAAEAAMAVIGQQDSNFGSK